MQKLSMAELNRKTPADFKQAAKNRIILVLDNVRSMHNVGSVFRSADAFLIEAICLCGYTPQPPHRDIQKTALGATETVEWLYYANINECLQALQQNGYAIYAVEQVKDSIPLQTFHYKNQPTALILGNEVEGVQQTVIAQCNGSIEIPQSGTKHSLNISVAAGLVLWHFYQQII
jgi:23S rRNA (guanosine2251-2'-O)-methyltransferase